MKKAIKLILGAFILLIIIGILADKRGNKNTAQPSSPTSQIESTQEGSKEPSDGGKITLDKFKQLKTGMSYKEAVSVLGKEGELTSENEVAGIKTVMYQWMNDDASNMNAIFQNDKLNSKAQFGLK